MMIFKIHHYHYNWKISCSLEVEKFVRCASISSIYSAAEWLSWSYFQLEHLWGLQACYCASLKALGTSHSWKKVKWEPWNPVPAFFGANSEKYSGGSKIPKIKENIGGAGQASLALCHLKRLNTQSCFRIYFEEKVKTLQTFVFPVMASHV